MLEHITLHQFNSLEGLEKIEALGEYGQIVAHKFVGEFKFILYQINYFYVEIKYLEKTNALVEIRSFKTTNLLDSYITHIDIDGL